MSGADLAAVVVTIAAVAATTVLVVSAWALRAALRAARSLVEQVGREAPVALAALRRAATEAEDELSRVDQLLDRADRVSATLEDASKLTYLAVANPVIKAAALASGVRSGARRLRGGGSEAATGPIGARSDDRPGPPSSATTDDPAAVGSPPTDGSPVAGNSRYRGRGEER